MQRIKKNATRCKIYGDVIESKNTHDFVTCSCGNVSVDGGHEYLHRSFQSKDKYEELSEYEEENEQIPKALGIHKKAE